MRGNASCDLGRLMISNFIEAASLDVLHTAPQSYVQQAQDHCVEHALKIFELCEIVLSWSPSFVPRDPYISVIFFQAVRIILWDLFRHPSPSSGLKKFTADTCKSSLIILYRMQKLYPYAQSVVSYFFFQHQYSSKKCTEVDGAIAFGHSIIIHAVWYHGNRSVQVGQER